MTNMEEQQTWRGFPAYPANKDSGVEWLGKIPAHWKVKRLKYVAAINSDALPEDTDPDYILKYIDIGNVDSNGSMLNVQELRFENAPSRARRIVRLGDTIISTVRTYLQAIAFIDDPPENLVVSTGFAVLRPSSEMYPKFLWRLVQSSGFVDAVVAHSEGVGYPAINPSRLAALPIWLPLLSEQRAIVDYLDRETAKIDALVTKKERLIELLQEKRTTLISHVVTGGLNPNVPMKDPGIEWLGEIPVHWEVAPIYSRYHVQLGKMLSQDAVKGVAPAPYLRNINVQWDRVDLSDLIEMDFDDYERRKFALIPGDLLVCEGGEVGRTAVWCGELENCYFQKAIHRVRPRRSSEEGRFLYYVLYSAAHRGVFQVEGNISTIVHLTAEKLRKHRFPFPPPSEQRTIATFLDWETSKIDALMAKVRDGIENLCEYRTALISAAVTGKIDVRNVELGSEPTLTEADHDRLL